MDVDDATLVREAVDGSRPAFDQLIRRHQVRLFSFLLQRLPNAQDAEDITQETFLRAWQRLHQYRPRYRFTTWLFTIGHRLAINHLRRRIVKPMSHAEFALEQQVQHDNGATPAERIIKLETRSAVWAAAADALSSDELEAMWLRYAEDLGAREIARVTGRTAVGVRVMLHRARQRLHEHLADHVEPMTEPVALPSVSIMKKPDQNLSEKPRLACVAGGSP